MSLMCTEEMYDKFSQVYYIHFYGYFLFFSFEKLLNGILNALNNHVYTMYMYILINVFAVIPIEIFWCYYMKLGLNGIWIG